MKTYILLIFSLHYAAFASSQNIIGAWETTVTTDNGKTNRNIVIITEGYQVSTWYDSESGAFVSTNGGSWSLEGSTMTEKVEFDTNDPERVGSSVTFEIDLTENELRIKEVDQVWTRVDDGMPGKLYGAWLMSGRKRDGEIQQRDTNRPRKTMKILSGTRFQWIAYNTETKQFMGTGGGTYTTVDGKYTENIEFFSRDNTRVGASLEFDFELKEGKWHHSGFSSKGNPLYEIWSGRD